MIEAAVLKTATLAPRKNGNEAVPEQQLPEHRQKTVEAGLATYQKVLADRDELEQLLRASNMKVEALSVQLESLKGVVNMMESTYLSTKLDAENRVTQYQTQRDEAVARTAALETTLANVVVVIRNAVVEPGEQ